MASTKISDPSASPGFVWYIENNTLYIAQTGYRSETVTIHGSFSRVSNNTAKALKLVGDLNMIIFPGEFVAAQLFSGEHSFTVHPCVLLSLSTLVS